MILTLRSPRCSQDAHLFIDCQRGNQLFFWALGRLFAYQGRVMIT